MLLRGGQDKNGVFWRFFQGLQKSIEGRLGEHMDLINNINLVLACLRGNAYLIYQTSDIVHRVVGSRIKFKNIEGKILIFPFRPILVDLFGQNTGTGGFAHTSWTAEQQGLGQMVVLDGIEQGIGNGRLAHNILECLGSIFSS